MTELVLLVVGFVIGCVWGYAVGRARRPRKVIELKLAGVIPLSGRDVSRSRCPRAGRPCDRPVDT